MKSHHIAVIPGDGIGKEVIPEGIKVLNRVAEVDGRFRLEFENFPWGCEYYLDKGRMMPPDGLAILSEFDAIYLGACGAPSVPDHISLWGMLLPIRKGFDQYVNLRPVRLLPGIESPLRDKKPEDIDFVCVRENTEGEYSGVGGRVHSNTEIEVALQTSVFTRHATERVIRFAFELAQKRSRKKVTSVTKSNAMQYGMVFWDDVFADVAAEHPDIETEKWLVDALAARFVTHPHTLDVVVGSNLMIDILSDLGGALQGSLGLSPSANLDPSGRYPSMFEPVHGSAPDIAGKGIANPIASIWAAAMMLEHLGEPGAAGLVMQAIEATTGEGILTPDLGGDAKTIDMGDYICHKLEQIAARSSQDT